MDNKATAETQREWRVVGTKYGREHTVKVFAFDHNEAVRRASHAPHMLCVRDVMLLDR